MTFPFYYGSIVNRRHVTFVELFISTCVKRIIYLERKGRIRYKRDYI